MAERNGVVFRHHTLGLDREHNVQIAARRLAQDAQHDHEGDVHRAVQIALGLTEIGGIEMEDGERDADDGDEAGEDGGIRKHPLPNEEFEAAFLLRQRNVCPIRHNR